MKILINWLLNSIAITVYLFICTLAFIYIFSEMLFTFIKDQLALILAGLLVVAIYALLMMGCTSYVFETGSQLADFQDSIYVKLKYDSIITTSDINRLNNNKWVDMAFYLAPCNLVVRHKLEQDMVNGNMDNWNDIMTQLHILDVGIWAEGYSYWKYTRKVMLLYVQQFGDLKMAHFIFTMDAMFMLTSNKRNGVNYPAPFGETDSSSLDGDFRLSLLTPRDTILFPIERRTKGDTIIYYINPCPIGFNSHTPIEYNTVKVYNDSVHGFRFYTGFVWDWDNYINPERLNVFTLRKYWRQFK